MTSSPERPEAEDEPEYAENYAYDSLDENYRGDSFNSRKGLQKTRRSSRASPRAKRGVSVPVGESRESSTINEPGAREPGAESESVGTVWWAMDNRCLGSCSEQVGVLGVLYRSG